MNYEPILVGVAAFAIIGVFHPIVIKAEYYFSVHIWWLFAVVGTGLLAASLFMQGVFSYIMALLGITCLWSIIELFHQKRRVEKGWYPKNPKFIKEKRS
ncbi:MAG: DUF4491 family protein [Treponema sp.]|nr:DUF4491 family protein [Treponema sp.]